LNVKTTETRKSKGIVKAAKGKVVKKHADRSSGDLLKAIKAMAKTGYSFDIRGGKFISIKADGEKEIESAELREMCNPVLERHARGIINRYIPGKGCPTKDKLIRDGLWDSMPAVIKDMLEGKAKKKAEKKDKKGSSDEDSEVSPEAASDKSPGASQAAGKQFSRLGDAITALILKGYEYEGILRMLRIGSIYDRGFPVLGDTWKASGTDKEHVNLAARIGSKKNAPVNKGEPTKASLIEEGLWEKFPAEVRRVIETGQDDLFLFCDPAVAEECAPRWDSFPWWLKIMSAAEKTEIVTDDRPGNVSNRNIFDRQKLAWLLSREITGKGNAAPMIERIFYPVRNGYLYRVVEHIARIRVQRKPVVGDIEESVQEYLASKKTEVKAGVPMHLISRRKRDNFDIAGKGEAELPPWINIFEKENYFTMIDRSTALANMPLSILCEDFMGDVYYPYKKFLADDIYWRNKEKEKETIDQRISDFFGSFTHMKHPYKSVTEELLSRFGIAYEPGKHSKEPGLALRAIFDSGKAETLRNKIVAYFSRLEGEKKPVNELYPGDSVRFAGDIWIVKRVDTKNREAQLLSMTSHTNLTLKPDKKKKMVTVLDKASVFAVSDDMPSWAPELSGEAPAGEAVPEAGESGEAAGIAPDSGASEEPLYVKVKDGRPLDNVKDFRNIKDVNELTRGLIEVIMSVLLSRERQSGEERPSGETVLTLAFSSRLSGLEESKLRDVIAEIDRLKKKDGFDKLLKNLRIINSFTGKAQLESELAAGGVSSDNPDTVTFVFAPDDENGELGLTGPNVKYVAINEKDVNGKTFDPMTYYYPLVEIVTLSLMQYHLDAPAWFMHTFLRRQMGMDIGDVNIDDFVDMGTDAFLLFDLIEKVKRHDIDGLPERYVRIQRAFDKAV
jgi:hypothetical protein